MSLRPALLVLVPGLAIGLLLPATLSAGTISFQLYALEASQADRLPLDVAASPTTLATHLQKLKDEGVASIALEFGGEFKWNDNLEFSKGEDFDYAATFTSEDEELKPDQRGMRFLGYKTSFRAITEKDGRARLQVAFEWTPTFEKIEIPKGGENGWVPSFHTIKSDFTSSAPPAEAFVAATWRTNFALTDRDKVAIRQLYLVMTWTTDPAN